MAMTKRKWNVYKDDVSAVRAIHLAYDDMKARCEKALTLLEKAGAFKNAQPFSVEIVEGWSAHTDTPRSNGIDAPTIPTGSSQVLIGVDLFSEKGEGGKLVACKANQDQALMFRRAIACGSAPRGAPMPVEDASSRGSNRAKRPDVLACRDCGSKVRIPGPRGCAEAVAGSRRARRHCSYRAPSFAVKCLRNRWGS